MSQRKDNSIWFPLFESLVKYMTQVIYPVNETGLEVIRIVDYVNENIADETGSYINENIVGYSFVKEDNSIYDETKTLIQSLVQGDIFTLEGIQYFLPSNLQVIEFNDKWNNTRIGDEGILIDVGSFDIGEDEDLVNTWRTPQIIIEMGKQSGVDIAERKGNTSSELKQLTFEFIILVNETNVIENITGYSETNRIEKILDEILYDYFNSKQCSHEVPSLNSNMKWTHDLEQIYRARPIVISSYSNLIRYR